MESIRWQRFVEAYAWIYKNDLPLVVTSDSILHAVHQSYANLLRSSETGYVLPELIIMLDEARAPVAIDANGTTDPALQALYQDVEDCCQGI